MNTVRSVWLGWGTLMVAGGTAFYFAKKDINVHRREQELKGIRGTEYLECIAPKLLPNGNSVATATRARDFQWTTNTKTISPVSDQ